MPAAYDPLLADDPRRLGRYVLAGRLGRGAQGVVYLARARDGREVAVKLLHADRVARPGARDRLAREAAAARRIRGRCTARILDVDTAGPRPYIVSEYVPGPSLLRQVREGGPLAGAPLDRLMIGTATALVAIHSAGIVHRDLKPANVLLGPEGPRVIDFGVAQAADAATGPGAPVGTPAFMAPELVAGAPAGGPADVFAWASTMVYAATGEPPFGRDTAEAVMRRVANDEPDLTDLHGPVRDLLAGCLRKDPAARTPADHVLRRLLDLSGRTSTRTPATRSRTAMLAAGTRAASAPEAPRSDGTEAVRNERRAAGDGRTGRPRPARNEPRGGAGRPGPVRDEPRESAGRAAGAGAARAKVPEWMRERARPVVRRARELPRGPKPAVRTRVRDAPAPPPARLPEPARPEARDAHEARPWADDRPARWDRDDWIRNMPASRRNLYVVAVILIMLAGLVLGLTSPWASSSGPPAPSPSAAP